MKHLRISLVLVVCLMLVACSFLNLTRKDLTEDEKARIAVDTGITSLDVAFTAGTVAVAVRPEYSSLWKTAVVPSITVGNHVALDFITIGETGGVITEAQVVSTLQARAFEILALIAVWETQTKSKELIATRARDKAKVKSSKPRSTVIETTYPPIPTWPELRVKANLLQAKLDSVK